MERLFNMSCSNRHLCFPKIFVYIHQMINIIHTIIKYIKCCICIAPVTIPVGHQRRHHKCRIYMNTTQLRHSRCHANQAYICIRIRINIQQYISNIYWEGVRGDEPRVNDRRNRGITSISIFNSLVLVSQLYTNVSIIILYLYVCIFYWTYSG